VADKVMLPQELAEYIRKGDREENHWGNLNKYINQAHDVGRIAGILDIINIRRIFIN